MPGDPPVEVLVVEDSASDARLIKMVFQQSELPNHVHIVTDGLAAMRFLHREGAYATVPRPDMVLLDLRLPGLSGQQVLAEIRADDDLAALPVVVLTASSSPEDMAAVSGLHANAFVAKPMGLEGFLRAVTEIEEFWFSVIKKPSPTDAPAAGAAEQRQPTGRTDLRATVTTGNGEGNR